MYFRDLLKSILDLIKNIFAKDQDYQSIKEIPAAKNQEAIELFKKVLKDQGIAELPMKYNHSYIYSNRNLVANWDKIEGLNMKQKNVPIEQLVQGVKSNLEATYEDLNQKKTETQKKIEKLEEFITILEEYNNK